MWTRPAAVDVMLWAGDVSRHARSSVPLDVQLLNVC